jgi:hypothetical protein
MSAGWVRPRLSAEPEALDAHRPGQAKAAPENPAALFAILICRRRFVIGYAPC